MTVTVKKKQTKQDKQTPVKPLILKVEDTDRMQLLLLSAEARALLAEANLAQAELNNIVATLDKDGKIAAAVAKLNNANAAQQRTAQKYAAVVQAVEGKLGVSMTGFAMNPETGVIKPIQQETGNGPGQPG